MKTEWKKYRKRILVLFLGIGIVAFAAGGSAWYMTVSRSGQDGEEPKRPRQQEQAVQTVTVEGSVSVGTVSQTFEMDLSEFTGESAQGFSWQAGMDFPQINAGSALSSGSDSRTLSVEEVYVTVGEEVKAGDPILKVTDDALERIREDLNKDVSEAGLVYEQMVTQQEQTGAEASAEKKENELYGKYADTEYNLTVNELTEAVEELQESILQVQESMAEQQEALAERNEELALQQEVLENAVYSVENEDPVENTYSWLVAMNAKVDAQRLIDSLEAEIEELEDSIAEQEAEIGDLNAQLTGAQRELETGSIEAESLRQTRLINLASAQEIYDVKTQLAQTESDNARRDYEEARERLNQLEEYLADGLICAELDGIVTGVTVSAGDGLQEGTELISINDYEDVTITVTLEESEMELAALGSGVLISFSAFPDETFAGEVTEIGDAQIDSNTNQTTYEVVVTVLENGSRLYEGMSAEVTFSSGGGTESPQEEAGN